MMSLLCYHSLLAFTTLFLMAQIASNVTNDNLNSTYSDGDEYENAILNAVSDENSQSKVKELINTGEWVYTYHLSAERENLLSWIDFKESESALEVGAGCGAITGLLCRKLGKVTAIEPSNRRLQILKERFKKYSNLETLTDNIQNLKSNEKYDYVTSIGVLEYSGKSIKAEDPFAEFINILKGFLKQEGKLIIAIENRFGLKYWSGAPEDHTGKYFEGIEGYPFAKDIQTFSKLELENLLKSQGFSKIDFFYPTPDYKFPTQIFSDKQLPSTENPISAFSLPSYHGGHREIIFDEKKVMEGIVSNNMFDFFSNSFLVIAQI